MSRETTVRFIGVISDSRCPLNALCIQAGDVVVDIELTVAGWAATAQLALGDAARTTAVHRGVHVTLTDVQPYPVAGDGPPVDPAQYRATVDVTWD